MFAMAGHKGRFQRDFDERSVAVLAYGLAGTQDRLGGASCTVAEEIGPEF